MNFVHTPLFANLCPIGLLNSLYLFYHTSFPGLTIRTNRFLRLSIVFLFLAIITNLAVSNSANRLSPGSVAQKPGLSGSVSVVKVQRLRSRCRQAEILLEGFAEI